MRAVRLSGCRCLENFQIAVFKYCINIRKYSGVLSAKSGLHQAELA